MIHNIIKFLTDNKGKSFTVKQIAKHVNESPEDVQYSLRVINSNRIPIRGCILSNTIRYNKKWIFKYFII